MDNLKLKNTYEIVLGEKIGSTFFEDEDTRKIFIATTPGKAKYQAYQYWSDVFEWRDGFGGFLKNIRVRVIEKTKLSDFFGNINTFEAVKIQRDIPFVELGMKVLVDGKEGYTVGGNGSANLNVYFPESGAIRNCHPYYKTKYFDKNGKVVADYNQDPMDMVVDLNQP